MEQSSISIINKNNGQITGESAGALPIMIKTSFSWLKIFLAGVVATIVVLSILFFTIETQVETVEIVGRSDNFQIMELK